MSDHHPPPSASASASAYDALESAHDELASIQPTPSPFSRVLRSTPSGKPEIDDALYPEQTMHPQVEGLYLRDLEYLDADSHLSCPICHITLIDPVSVQCGHYFCAECLAKYWATAQRPGERLPCPTCRTTVTSTTSAPRVIINMCNDVNVKCPSGGCGRIMARGDLQTHVTQYCMERAISCPNHDCQEKIKRKHYVLGLCRHATHTECTCGDLILSEEMGTHKKVECPLRKAGCIHCHHPITHSAQVPHECEPKDHCPGQDFGCDVYLTPSALLEHTKTCPLAKMTPYLKTHIANSLAPLQEQLTQSQQRVKGLEEGIDKLSEAIESATKELKQSRREPSPSTPNPSPSPTSPSHQHLLSLHENLRGIVTSLSLSQTDLTRRIDETHAHTSLVCINDRLRLEEQLSVLSNAMFSTRAQVQWLLNREKRTRGAEALRGRGLVDTAAVVVVGGQAESTSEESGAGVDGSASANGNEYPSGTGLGNAGLPLRPARRTSGGGSQERVKL